MEQKKITFDRFIRGTLFCLLLVGVLMLTNRLSNVLLPFFIAWLIAYLIYPLVRFFEKQTIIRSRIIAIFCSLITITLGFTLLFYFLIPPIIEESVKFKDLVIQYYSQDVSHSNIPESLSNFIRENLDKEFITKLFSNNDFTDALKSAVPQLWKIVSGSINLLMSVFTFFIILLYVVFILLDYESISKGWIPLIPQKYRNFIINLYTDVKDGMNHYFRGQAFVALCVGILFSIGFLIIDFPMAIGLGLFIGLLNMVPYLQIIGFIPTILLAILKAADTGGNFWVILGLAFLVFVVVQAIQDGFIVPKVMGKITGLNPAIILLSLSIWGSLMGVIGMIIALPLTTLLLSYYRRFIINKEEAFRVSLPLKEEGNKENEQ